MDPILMALALALGPILEPIMEHVIMDKVPTVFKPFVAPVLAFGGWIWQGLQHGLDLKSAVTLAAVTASSALTSHKVIPTASAKASMNSAEEALALANRLKGKP